jgi:superfamily II DNA/RNA helicase
VSSLGNARIVITSDLLGRGFDSKDIDLVVQWDRPFCPEDSLHRVGRAGRRGQSALAVLLWRDPVASLFDWGAAARWMAVARQDARARQQELDLGHTEVMAGQWRDISLTQQELAEVRHLRQCQQCLQLMQDITSLTGYKFRLLE